MAIARDFFVKLQLCRVGVQGIPEVLLLFQSGFTRLSDIHLLVWHSESSFMGKFSIFQTSLHDSLVA